MLLFAFWGNSKDSTGLKRPWLLFSIAATAGFCFWLAQQSPLHYKLKHNTDILPLSIRYSTASKCWVQWVRFILGLWKKKYLKIPLHSLFNIVLFSFSGHSLDSLSQWTSGRDLSLPFWPLGSDKRASLSSLGPQDTSKALTRLLICQHTVSYVLQRCYTWLHSFHYSF